MNLAKRLISAGILSLGILSACQTINPAKETVKKESYENPAPLGEKEKALLKKEVSEYKNLELYVCTHCTILLAWNKGMPGERQEYYEIGSIYENDSGQKFLPMNMIRMREDKNRNRLDRDDKWDSDNKKGKKIIWRRDQSHYPDYFIIRTSSDKDGDRGREYYYTEKKKGAIHSSFILEKIAWDRNNDCKFSEEEIIWGKGK